MELPVLNNQPSEKPDYTYDGTLDVHSIFRTIQGEGPDAGRPAVFVRLAGCNLRCPNCDTEYTVGRRRMTLGEVRDEIDRLIDFGGFVFHLIVLTGGEPFRQRIAQLVVSATPRRWAWNIETNGTHWDGGFELPNARSSVKIICSPKTPKIHPDVEKFATAYKYVVAEGKTSESTGLPTTILGKPCEVFVPSEDFRSQYPHRIYIQPEDNHDSEKNARNLDHALAVCQKFGYRISLQIHKLLGME